MADNSTSYGLRGSERGALTRAIQNLTGAPTGTKFSDKDIKNFLQYSYENYSNEELAKQGITNKTYKAEIEKHIHSVQANRKQSKELEKAATIGQRQKVEALKEKMPEQVRNQLHSEMAKAVKAGNLGEVMIQSSKSSSPWDNLHLIKVNSPKAGREVVGPSLTRPLPENYELNTNYVVAQNTVNNTGSKNSKSAGKPSGGGNLEAKGKIGKYGKSALGLGVMLTAGSVITGLMMGSSKGRLNNSQMYGQQPYTQY